MIDESLTLKKIEIFLAFMEVGTLSGTAEKLDMSTVSVHRAIHSLEEGLKCPLFRQEGRLLVPLPSATVLAEKAEQAIYMLDEAVKSTRETAGIYSNQFSLGALYSLTLSTVPKLIAGLKLRKSELNIELTLDSNQALFNKLRSLDLDVALVSLEPGAKDDDYLFLPLYSDQVFLATPADSPLPSGQPVDLRDFQEETFVTLTQDFATNKDSYKAFKQAGFEPNVVMEVGDIFSLISMVSAGIGFALLPKRVEAVFENKIKLHPVKGIGDIQQEISMVCLASRERDPRILACIAECRVYALELAKKNV